MNRHTPLTTTRVLLSVLLSTVLPLYSCTSPSRISQGVALPSPVTVETPCTEEVLTGNELEVVNRYVRSPSQGDEHRFANVLDQAMRALLTKVYPEPERTSLVRRTLLSICLQTQRLSGKQIPEETRGQWVRQVLATQSFEGTLKEAEAILPAGESRKELIDAGLKGMLDSVGWLLEDAQVRELRAIEANRASGREPGVLGIDLGRWPIVSPVPGGPAEQAGLRDGDTILNVDGTSVETIHEGSEAVALLAGPAGQEAVLTVRRSDQVLPIRVRRVASATWLICHKVVAPGVLYIKIPTFEGTQIATKVEQILRGYMSTDLRAVILDLRDNPGGRPEQANGIADLFLDDATLETFEFRDGRRVVVKSHPGALSAVVVLLAGPDTGSAAEMLSMALRDNRRATIVGEPTAGMLFGKDIQNLDDGRAIVLRCEPRILSATGKDYSENGIPPDISVSPAKGIGEDHALRRAIQVAVEQTGRSQPAPNGHG